jgi:hypothetical protein
MEEGADRVKNPANWKLISKNRKQWMKKRFIKVKQEWRVGSVTLYGW